MNIKNKTKNKAMLLVLLLCICFAAIFFVKIDCDVYYRTLMLFPEANITMSEDGTKCTADYWEHGYHYYVTFTDGQSGDYTVVYDASGNIVISGSQVDCFDYTYTHPANSTASASSETTTANADTSTTAQQSDENDNESDVSSTSSNADTKNDSSIQGDTSYTDEEIETAWEETNRVESTCTETGFIEYTNSLTGDTKTEELELANHSYEEVEHIESTCVEDGSATYTCSVCGDTYTETLPATGHTYEWITTKEAGLFTEGLEEEVCSVCGEKSGETHTLSAQSPVPFAGVIGIIVVVCGGITGFVIYKKKKC